MDITSTLTLHTGNEIPILGLGTWQMKGDSAVAAITRAFELGYRLIDTSGDYGNQHAVGKAIRASGLNRDDIYLVTKVEETDNAYLATQADLKELGLDYADLMLIHRPPRSGAGVELWEGLIQARDDGMARDIGVSNYSIDEIEEILEETGEMPAVNQIEWSPFGYSREMLDYCLDNDIIIQAYSPLTRTKRLDEDPLEAMAKRHGKTPSQIIIRWNLQHEVVPIPKAEQSRHLEENIDVFDFELSDSDMRMLDQLNETYSSLGSLAYV